MEGIGWTGAAFSLTAYSLNSLNMISSQSFAYLIMNIIGCFFLIIYTFSKKAYANSVLNSIWLLMTLVQQHQQLRQGGSAFGVDIGYGQGRSAGGWFGRWQERRRQRAAIEREREEEAEQDVLDRLLAKVSEQGLPSLTASERAVLERISRRQRARAAAERV